MIAALDYRVEIIKARPQSITSPDLGAPVVGDVIDVSAHVELDGLGSINRAVERDLLSFKTGDVTITFDNPGGFFDDLFFGFTATTFWGLKIYWQGNLEFHGCIVGPGSIEFDRKARSVEITAYGLTKLLDQTSTESLKRTFAAMSITAASSGATTLTLNTTAGLLAGDVLHITNHVLKEDVTVKQVTSATVVSLEAPLVNTYGASTVTCTTPFPRYKAIDYLVGQLFTAAGFPASTLLSDSQFRRAAPTPVNLEGLTLTADARRGSYQFSGKWGIALAALDSYAQEEPDDAWIVQGLTDKGVYDWSPYYVQGFWPGGPVVSVDEPFPLYEPVVGATQEVSGAGTTRFATYWGGADYYSATKRIWGIGLPGAATTFAERTTTDGVTYTAATTVALPGSGSVTIGTYSLDYDPVRNIVHVCWRETGLTSRFQYRDLGGAAWVDCKQADDDSDTGYFGARYVADKDYTLVLRQDGGHLGPTFEICAFRGATRLWKRPFPACLIQTEVTGNPFFYPTRTARCINGIIYITLVSDGAVQMVWSDDDFQTYTMRKLADATSKTTIMACRVQDTYRIACYKGTVARGYYIAAPLYAGVIEYPDFEGLSGAEALKKLAILANAHFQVDDDMAGQFVARDLYDAGAVLDISDRVMERSDGQVWEETAQYTTVSGNGFEATAGDNAFAADGIELESSLIPTEAFAQASADDYQEFYSVPRIPVELTVLDTDGHIYRAMDRVVVDGTRYLVLESDKDCPGREVTLTVLEDI